MDKIKRQKEIQDSKLDLESKAAYRWNKRREFRENPREYLEKNENEKAKLETRYETYNIRESARPMTDVIHAEVKVRTNERRIGDTLDLSKRPPSPEAFTFGRPVGRIFQIPDPGLEIDAFGTGFLIAPNILITNHHVFPSIAHAEGCAVNFGFEYNEFNKLQSGTKFKLTPSTLFFSDKKLDFAIVYVEGVDVTDRTQLSELGCIPLIATKGKVVLDDPINIVQYPLGNYKQYSTINNFVKDILEEDGYIQYSTDTLESSSGSPAANKFWEVVALHHSGIAMTVGDQVWSRFDKPWDERTMTDEDKIYIANEGISVSRIVACLNEAKINAKFNTPRELELINLVIANSQDKILENISAAVKTPNVPMQLNGQYKQIITPSSMAQNTFNFYNTANVFINTNDGKIISDPGKDTEVVAALEKKLRFDEKYSNRKTKGYKAGFLGVNIPIPKVANSRKTEIYNKENSNDPLILNYYHYSLVMNKKFRLQMWSAVNVDYEPTLKSSRERKEFGNESNSWRADKRIPIEIQITDEEFYKPATKVDRGHMVRRDDSCYGRTELEIEYANADTFHWTNCTPQHEGFNQSSQFGLWGLLENAVKDGLSGDDTKASIFAGPVLIEDPNRIFNNIHYPVKFWKVIAAIDENDGLMAYGFILDQTKVVDKHGLEAKFDFSQFKTQQVGLKRIEDQAGIIFPQVLKNADVLLRSGLSPDDEIDLESKDSIVIKIKK